MKHRVLFLAAACVAAFAACQSAAPESSSFHALPTSAFRGDRLSTKMAPAKPGTTTAWGDVYSDPEARPLKGVQVRLKPWDRGCIKVNAHEAKCPGYLPWHTVTNATGRFTLTGVPNGEYLLVIGTDLPSDLVHPTIHDHVTLTGGVQHLLAPNLPAIPCVDKAELSYCGILASPDVTPFPRPEVERNGMYRLATLDAKGEVPCAVGFDAKRATRRLAPIVVDEWLTENTREMTAYNVAYVLKHHGVNNSVPQVTPFLADGNLQGTPINCAEQFDWITDPFWSDPRTLWFAGEWRSFEHGNQSRSVDEYLVDPRVKAERYGFPVGPWL